MKIDSLHIIERIRGMASAILPPNSRLLLYGSRARGDSHEDSDWDMLIILDKHTASHDDYDRYAFPFHMLGAELQQVFSPIVYGIGQWKQMTTSPFYENVQNDKIELF